MDRRGTREIVAANMRAAIIASGTDITSAAEAAQLSASELTDRLEGRVPVSIPELARLGGFFCLAPHEFLKGVA